MPVTVLSLGPTYNILQNVVYALSGAPCYVKAGALLERADLEAGPFTSWPNSTGLVYNFRGGFVRCPSGNTTVTPTKVKMKQAKSLAHKIISGGASNYWKLNETSGTTAVDIIGGANGTISGGVTLNGESGMTFNGTDAAKVTTSLSGVFNNVSAATIEFWAKLSALPGSLKIAVELGNNQSYFGYNPANSGWYTTLYINSAQQLLMAPVNDTNWHHIVRAYSSGKDDFYVDGIRINGGTWTGTITNSGPLLIGNYGVAGFGWPGSIDDVAIYPRALSAQEIADHYKSR